MYNKDNHIYYDRDRCLSVHRTTDKITHTVSTAPLVGPYGKKCSTLEEVLKNCDKIIRTYLRSWKEILFWSNIHAFHSVIIITRFTAVGVIFPARHWVLLVPWRHRELTQLRIDVLWWRGRSHQMRRSAGHVPTNQHDNLRRRLPGDKTGPCAWWMGFAVTSSWKRWSFDRS